MKNSIKVQRRKKQIRALLVFILSGAFSGKSILHSEDNNSPFFLSVVRSIFHNTLHQKFFLLEHKSLVRKQKWEGTHTDWVVNTTPWGSNYFSYCPDFIHHWISDGLCRCSTNSVELVKGGNWASESLSDMPVVTKLVILIYSVVLTQLQGI